MSYLQCPNYLFGSDSCCRVGQANTCSGQSGTCPSNPQNKRYSLCPPNLCDQTDCNNRGVGAGTRPNCVCECDPPYTGTRCETARDRCTRDLCNGHGDPRNAYRDDAGSCNCDCDAGWEGDTCDTQACIPTQVANSDKSGAGSISGNSGDTVQVNCDAGYTGGGAWTCSGGTFSGAECTANSCGATQVANSDKSGAGAISGDTGATVQVNCDAGYTGGGTWTCGVDGTFSGTVCSASSCSATQVANSDQSGAGAISGDTGATVDVNCDDGYTGGGTWTCGVDGTFSGTVCSANSCGATQVANSDKSAAGSISGDTGDVVQVACDDGYTGGGAWTCGVDGNFSGSQCTANSCSATEVANSDKSAAGSISGDTGATVQVVCDDGYTGGGAWTCGVDGNFSGSQCTANSCSATQVSNSDQSAAGSISGDTGATVQVACDAGYTGGGAWTCGADGTFSGTVCSANACTPTQVANSDQSGAGSITGNTGDTVQVSCDAGYAGGGTWTCGADGTFTGSGCSQTSCTATQVANSDKSGAGSITGVSGDTVQVTCNVGYQGGGAWTCGADGTFTGSGCTAMTPCTSADDCNNHASSVTGYREDGSCSCSCAVGYTGDACENTTTCTIDDNCSGAASAVSGDVATGCSCTCNPGRGGADCSETLTPCTVEDNCGGSSKSTGVSGYQETGCTCQCNNLWIGADCSEPSDADRHPCLQAGFECINGGQVIPGRSPGANGVLPGTCACVGCDAGYTDGEGSCSDSRYRTSVECQRAGGVWTESAGYTCETPNEDCTLSVDVNDRGNAAAAENGVYYCGNGGSVNTIRPYSDANGRLCGCQCGQGDDVEFKCKNKVLDTGDLAGSCNADTDCSYSGARLTCQPNGQAYQSCASHNDQADCNSHSECAWNGTFNQCVPSQAAKDTCSAMTDNDCLAQGSGCTLRGECNPKVSATRTGYGGPQCEEPQNAILAQTGDEQDLSRGIIWCNNQGYAAGKTGSASCACFPGYTGANCETVAGSDTIGCPTQDASCPAGQACCERPEVDFCTGQETNGEFPEIDQCTRANQARLGVGQTRQQRCESQSYFADGEVKQCKFHDRDPTDSAWNYFDQTLDETGANRLHPKCQCDCTRKAGTAGAAGPLINSDQRYQLAPDGLSCIANCSEISPGDNICEGLTGDALQTCRTNNAPCFGRGACDPTTNKCVCNTGFSGEYCQYDMAGFQGKDCGAFGEGAAPEPGSGDSYQCVCKGDWSKSGLDLNNDGVARCDLDPCHQGVERELQEQSFPSANSGALTLKNYTGTLSVPTITKDMGVRWDFAADGTDLPIRNGNSLADVQNSLKVVSFAPAGSPVVTDDFETGTDANALAGNSPYVDANGNAAPIDAQTQILMFKMQGTHSANTGLYDKVILNFGTFLPVDTKLNFFYRTKGTVSCRVFDTTQGSDLGDCRTSSDGQSRSCGCKQGWDTNPSTLKCTTRCKFGTWGPGCVYKMDGTSAPDPDTGIVPNLCDSSTLNDETLESLKAYSTVDGLPSRLVGITDNDEFKAALNPDRTNASCRVIDRGDGALDIVYDCNGQGMMAGPTNDGAQVSAQWQKGTDQDGGETLAGGYVTHASEGQCLQPIEGGGNVLCQAGGGDGPEIREDNGNTAADCTETNTGSAQCSWQTVNLSRQCPADNAGLDTLFSTMDDRETCRTMQCSRTNCGATNAVPDSWHATKDDDNQLTACVKNQHGGNLDTNYSCPGVSGNWSNGDMHAAPGINTTSVAPNQGLVAARPAQFSDGRCAVVMGCDHCGCSFNGTCPDGTLSAETSSSNCDEGSFLCGGDYRTCTYDSANPPSLATDCHWHPDHSP